MAQGVSFFNTLDLFCFLPIKVRSLNKIKNDEPRQNFLVLIKRCVFIYGLTDTVVQLSSTDGQKA